MEAAGLRYASFGRRLLATVLDLLLFISLVAPVLYLLYGEDYFRWYLHNDALFAYYGALDAALTLLLPLLVTLFCWRRFQATPGKVLLGLRVVDAKTLDTINGKQGLIRYVGYLLAALPAYLGFLWILVDKRRQGLHDKLASTVVIVRFDDESQKSIEQLMGECH